MYNGYLQLGAVVFKTLETNVAGYHNLDANGHQVLLNYRATPQIAKTVVSIQVLG
jgi:CHASE2 domain-containing sensor protein